MAGTWQLKKKEGGGCSVSENSGGNRNGGTIKKYDRALIDVKTTTLIDRRTVCAANGRSRNRRGIASFSFLFYPFKNRRICGRDNFFIYGSFIKDRNCIKTWYKSLI